MKIIAHSCKMRANWKQTCYEYIKVAQHYEMRSQTCKSSDGISCCCCCFSWKKWQPTNQPMVIKIQKVYCCAHKNFESKEPFDFHFASSSVMHSYDFSVENMVALKILSKRMCCSAHVAGCWLFELKNANAVGCVCVCMCTLKCQTMRWNCMDNAKTGNYMENAF